MQGWVEGSIKEKKREKTHGQGPQCGDCGEGCEAEGMRGKVKEGMKA